MKHNSDLPGQLALFTVAPTVETRTTIHDPYWDEILAPEHPEPETRWNPAHFGEVPHKVSDNGQLTIFFDDSDEPPDPDDYQNLDDYHQAWADWEIRVRAQVTASTVVETVKSPVRAQVTLDTEKIAPEHPQPLKVGDLVKLSPDWMDKCAAATTGKFKKDYQYKSDDELISEVIWLDPDKGHIYVARGNNEALFVPDGCYTVEVVRAQVSKTTQKIAPEQNTHWVEKYWVQRLGNKYWYYRYCWMSGRKKNRRHIGSVDSVISKRKKADVEIAITSGQPPSEIEKLIHSWRPQSPAPNAQCPITNDE
ncbi:hypothetical protein [Nostoc sp. ChiSLP03a]|uniref:hypothetical protein n=1 Tax=Nostoc sp. ChiSLP03a TaxID=3075380 RepID=UPI002AD46866|nr:hypothetical protein [Nostoc sp. ChiSLP03a]MDZ8211618.1 hypothetical protein [Nostoc sp. ChiSLP03a]